MRELKWAAEAARSREGRGIGRHFGPLVADAWSRADCARRRGGSDRTILAACAGSVRPVDIRDRSS